MLKLVKYEFSKSRFILLIATVIFVILEGWYLINYALDDMETMGVAAGFLTLAAIASFFMVFVMGIVSYSNELKSKQGYMIFMTPTSTLKIVLSKLVYVFFLGTVVIGIVGMATLFDFKLLADKMNQEFPILEMLDLLDKAFGIDVLEGITLIGLQLLTSIMSFYSVVVMAYLAITFSATVLQNNKVREIISFVLFIVIVIALARVEEIMITKEITAVSTFVEALIYIVPSLIYNTVITVLGIMGTTYLLDKKISL